jgi:adenine-specific DNA methylase
MTRFISAWAIRSADDIVLEPSCGDAAFLLAAGERLRELDSTREIRDSQLHGVELHVESAQSGAVRLANSGLSAKLQVEDFFDVAATPKYDAVIGNPPYIRYQDFAGSARTKSLERAFTYGVRLSGLASSWAAFTVHAAHFLKPGGRLGLVLPAELLTVNYAAQVRRFLFERFGTVRLVLFEELVFPGVSEEVVLLLAEGQGPAPFFEVHQVRDLKELTALDQIAWAGYTPEHDGKWTPALLPFEAITAYRQLAPTVGGAFSPLLTWGETYLGAVSGNNRYFTLNSDEVMALGLSKRDWKPCSPPGSRHLRGLRFSEASWDELARDGERCYLFAPDIKKPSAAANRYIEAGLAEQIHKGYKCRTRNPWWRVPTVSVADLFLTYMDHERPRLVANDARVYHLNSLYGVTLRHGLRELGRDLLPLAALNSVTLLGAELVGRAYGGGLLKLEPREADLMPVPSEATIRATADELRAIRPHLAKSLRQGKLMDAVKLVDRVLLTKHLGVKHEVIISLREARELLFSRRAARRRSSRGED